MNGSITLWHLEVSHYSEKARWALAHKGVEHRRRTPIPGTHIPIALWLTRGRQITFPVLDMDGGRIGDSTAIIATLENAIPITRSTRPTPSRGVAPSSSRTSLTRSWGPIFGCWRCTSSATIPIACGR